MKNTLKHSFQKRRYLLAAGIVVVIVGLYLASAALFHFWPLETVSIHKDYPSSTAKTSNPSPKNNNSVDKQNATVPSTNDQTSDQVPVNDTFLASITQLSETSNQVTFSATVQNTGSAGTCVVTFSNPNDRPVTKQFSATNNNNTSICGPISFSANEFSYLGTWQVAFHYYTGDQQATAESSIIIR